MKITGIILAKDEENSIKTCIESLKWCDEILVIDDESSDNTREIAKKMGCKVFIRSLNKNFSEQRNFGLEKASGEWTFFIDADEVIPPLLKQEINKYINDPNNRYSGFYIKRKDIMWGKELKYGETGNIKLLRLARRSAGKWVGKVHEVWIVKGVTGELLNPIFHYPHPNVTEFLREINFYTTLRAEELFHQHIKVNWWDIIIYPKGKFIINYFIKFGFLDGIEGLVISLMMSFHSFLVRGKLWQLNNENKGR